jgi:hypothetical protein
MNEHITPHPSPQLDSLPMSDHGSAPVVVIPWRSQPSREYAHDLTVARWRSILPGVHVIDIDTGDEPFDAAACRNEGVRRAEHAGFGVVVVSDADTLVEREPLLAAVEGATTTGRVHLPYTECRSLRADGSAQYRAGRPPHECAAVTVHGSCGGVYVTTPATWWAHGGQDGRFKGWGFEDAAWEVAHTTLLGSPPVRHEGHIYVLYHTPALKEGAHYEANLALCNRYHQASGDTDAMRTLIGERSCRP